MLVELGLVHLISWKWSLSFNAMWCLRNWSFYLNMKFSGTCWICWIYFVVCLFFSFPSLLFYWCPLPIFLHICPTSFTPSPSFVFHLFLFFPSILPLSTCLPPPLPLPPCPVSCFLTVRRTLWSPWPLTPSLSVCPCHRGAGQEAVARKRGQVKPNRNASMSRTSPFALETQTSARCLGYDSHLVSELHTYTEPMFSCWIQQFPLCENCSDTFSNLARSSM